MASPPPPTHGRLGRGGNVQSISVAAARPLPWSRISGGGISVDFRRCERRTSCRGSLSCFLVTCLLSEVPPGLSTAPPLTSL